MWLQGKKELVCLVKFNSRVMNKVPFLHMGCCGYINKCCMYRVACLHAASQFKPMATNQRHTVERILDCEGIADEPRTYSPPAFPDGLGDGFTERVYNMTKLRITRAGCIFISVHFSLRKLHAND